MKIIVGTNNEAKVAGIRQAFEHMFPKSALDILSINVPTSVSKQPMTSKETLAGACYRAQTLFETQNADFFVGLESGLRPSVSHPGNFSTIDWACIANQEGVWTKGSFGGVYLPCAVSQAISNGKSLKQAMLSTFPDYTHSGALDYLTHGFLHRQKESKIACINALVPHVHPYLYQNIFNCFQKTR